MTLRLVNIGSLSHCVGISAHRLNNRYAYFVKKAKNYETLYFEMDMIPNHKQFRNISALARQILVPHADNYYTLMPVLQIYSIVVRPGLGFRVSLGCQE
jgi:hypothetical protein